MRKKVFLSGIAGTGMSALAGLFQQSGWQVSGSDVRFYPPVGELLDRMGVKLHTGFAADHIAADTDLCVIGNVICRGNPEAEHILDEGREYCSMAEALGKFFIKGKTSVVVAGTHGKTTLTSFVAHLLESAGMKPGFFIGGKPINFSANYRVGDGDYFVSEGDEYDTAFFDRSPKFLKYRPRHLIIPALEHDHLDLYASEESYLKSFLDLVDLVPGKGMIIANADFPMARRAVAKALTPVVFYGENDGEYRITNIQPGGEGFRFELRQGEKHWPLAAKIPGPYNAWNLAAGIILGLKLGLSMDVVSGAVASFRGVERRLQLIRRKENTLFFEDFAHHPTAIAAVLQSIRHLQPDGRIIAVFEPRSWSLRRNFFQDRLAGSFLAADEIVLKDVYQKERIAAADRLDVSLVISQLEKTGKTVHFFAEYDEVKTWLQSLDCRREQVVVILSNGDFGGIPRFVREWR